MKNLSISLLADFAFSTDPPASADKIPNLFLYPNVSLSGDWRIIVDPYESGSFDYRWTQRDKLNCPNRSETIYLGAHPDKSPSLKVPGNWNTQELELFYYEGSLSYRRTYAAEADRPMTVSVGGKQQAIAAYTPAPLEQGPALAKILRVPPAG